MLPERRPTRTRPLLAELDDEITRIAREQSPMHAVKFLRAQRRMPLRDALQYVDDLVGTTDAGSSGSGSHGVGGVLAFLVAVLAAVGVALLIA